MIDVAYSFGMPFWAIPADRLLNLDDAETRTFMAEFDLIAGNSLFLPNDDRGAAARAERLASIRAAAEANTGKLLFVGNDLAFEDALPLDQLAGRSEIQPLSLYTWRYVIDLERAIPGEITDHGTLIIEGAKVEPESFCRGKILRAADDVLIPADDPVSAQIYAALVAAGRDGEHALTIPLEHLAVLCTPAEKFWAFQPPAIIDALCFRGFSGEVDAKIEGEAKTAIEVATIVAASRNGIEADLTPTHGVRDAWRLIGIPPLWQQVCDDEDLSLLRKSIGHITDEHTGDLTSPIYGGELLPPDNPRMAEIYRRLEKAYGVPRSVSIEDEEGLWVSKLRLYQATTHYALLHEREEYPIDMFIWDRPRN